MTNLFEEYVITVVFKARPGKEKALEKFLTSAINIAMQSSGYIEHSLHRQLNYPSTFMFYERWD